jgi:hypothetical protein
VSHPNEAIRQQRVAQVEACLRLYPDGVTSIELGQALGMSGSATNHWLRVSNAHIDRWVKRTPGRGRHCAVWVFGPGEHCPAPEKVSRTPEYHRRLTRLRSQRIKTERQSCKASS